MFIPFLQTYAFSERQLGYAEKKGSDVYIWHPNRTEKSRTIMDALSKACPFYKDEIGITSDVSMKNLRKTYISNIRRLKHCLFHYLNPKNKPAKSGLFLFDSSSERGARSLDLMIMNHAL